jgi:hypothetical protein
MNYLDALESELKAAGIPTRRRTRIIAEFADHLHENPEAELGAPRDLARQFADELGTRLARRSAYWAFAVLAAAGVLLVDAFFQGGRLWAGWVGYGHDRFTTFPTWYLVTLVVCMISAQVALAAGLLALARAYRLRRVPVISAADAQVLNRRAAVALIAGAITMLVLPLSQIRLLGYSYAWWMHPGIGIAVIVLVLTPLPAVLRASRLRPTREGEAGDLRLDLGAQNTSATPWHVAFALSALILVVLTVIGIGSDDPLDGLARGLVDAVICLAGFVLLGNYLGLRSRATG